MRPRTFFTPSAVSSFFEICDQDEEGDKVNDPLFVGSRGGGFRIALGTFTKLEVSEANSTDEVYINGLRAEGKTTLAAIRLMRRRYGFKEHVRVEHMVGCPIGCGFGTSAAGAVGTALALSDALRLNISLTELGQIAHVAEVVSVTGLGTVIATVADHGAVGVVDEPGAPGIGRIRMFPCRCEGYRLVTVTFGPIDKASVLASEDRRRMFNGWGRRALEKILDDPSPENLLRQSRIFAEQTGLAERRRLDLADWMTSVGALGATQNMIGDAVHALVPVSKLRGFLTRLYGRFSVQRILVSELYAGGPSPKASE